MSLALKILGAPGGPRGHTVHVVLDLESQWLQEHALSLSAQLGAPMFQDSQASQNQTECSSSLVLSGTLHGKMLTPATAARSQDYMQLHYNTSWSQHSWV